MATIPIVSPAFCMSTLLLAVEIQGEYSNGFQRGCGKFVSSSRIFPSP
jgi:hypothetical protein